MGAVEGIIIRIVKGSSKDWNSTEEGKAKILKCCNVVQRDWLNIQIQTCTMLAWSGNRSRDQSSGMAK